MSTIFSKSCLGISSIFTLVISFVMSGVYIHQRCEQILHEDLMILQLVIFVFAFLNVLIGLASSSESAAGCFCGISIVLFLLVFSSAIAIGQIAQKGRGYQVPGILYEEYQLSDYSSLLRNRVSDPQKWNRIKNCIQDKMVCEKLALSGANTTVKNFYRMKLSSIESGCCKPLDECDFTYVSPTNWTKTTNSTYGTRGDCKAWDNNPKVLCLDCLSCKAGVVDKYNSHFRCNCRGNGRCSCYN